MLASAAVILAPSESDAVQNFGANAVPGSPADYSDARLWILGNANGDMVIDSKDIEIINDAIAKKATVEQAPMCDANNDKAITADDVEFVESLIDGTAVYVNYYNVDGKICEFYVYEKINAVALHRCVVRSATVLANFDNDVKIVGMDSSPYGEIEFNVSKNYPGVENVGVIKEMDSEKFASLQSKYMKTDDECLVILIGTVDYYLNNLETWAENYDYQVIRMPTWEHHPTEGILTTAYLFAGVGNNNDRNDDTCWNHALKYGDWAFKYLDKIEEQSSKLKEDDKMKILGIYTTTVNYEHTDQTRGPKSGDYENYAACGGNNIATRFGPASNQAWTMENIASYCKDLDVLVLMSANCFSEKSFNVNDDMKELTEKMNGYVKKGCKVYAMTWALNGAPFVVQMAYYAHVLMPDNKEISSMNVTDAWNEYLKLVGWDKRTDISFDLNKVCSSLTDPGVTTIGDDEGGSIDMTMVIGAVVALVLIIAVVFFVVKKR